MKAIEIYAKTDSKGHLKLDYNLDKFETQVKVLILMEEDDIDDEKLWLSAVSKSESFNFLNEPEEDIYTLKDGEKLND